MILAVIVEHAAGNSVGMQPALPDHRPLAYVNEDFSQANNLAEKNPAKLKELQDAPSSTKLSGLRVNAQDLSARVAGEVVDEMGFEPTTSSLRTVGKIS
jgi:hypothetical protein